MLDLDAPFPSFGALGPIEHWVQPGFKAGPNNVLTTTEPFVANYIPPGMSTLHSRHLRY